MKVRAIAAVVVSAAALAVPAEPAHAARGFSWTQAPVDVGLVVRVIQAKWHANYADPRCPMRADLDERPDEHVCGDGLAEIGVLFLNPKALVRRGMDSGVVPTDDYTDDVIGACIDSPSEGWLYGSGPDRWQAVWTQNIYHRPDHHMGPHLAPVLVEQDVRESPVSSPPRCDYTQVQA